jgi:hypothetical protein
MQILCQPFFLFNPLILGIYYVLKIRRLQCYKYTFFLQVFEESTPTEDKPHPYKQIKVGLMNQTPTEEAPMNQAPTIYS